MERHIRTTGRQWLAVLAVGLVSAPLALGPARGASASPADVLTHHNDNARTGQTLSETALTPASVNAAGFGKMGFLPADGKVDAQPLYVRGLQIPGQGTHNAVFVATEHASVFAYDADTGAKLWQVSLL